MIKKILLFLAIFPGIFISLATPPPGCTISVSSATTTIANPSCTNNDGTITIAGVTGGSVSPYVYQYSIDGVNWQQSATLTGLSAGNYTVQIRDRNAHTCSSLISGIILTNAPLGASVATTPVSCNGAADGKITVTASGGTGNYQYSLNGGTSWSNNGGLFTGIGTLTHDVQIRDKTNTSCTFDYGSVTLTQPAVLKATVTSTNVTCNGNDGTATANATGGTPSYSYLWNDPSSQTVQTATGLSPGNYTVTVTDANGCTTTASVAISQPNALSATVSSTNVTCSGASNGTIIVIASGGWGSYQYSKDGGITWLNNGGSFQSVPSGNYDIWIRDKANPFCTYDYGAVNGNVIITHPTVLNATVISTNVTCNGNDGTAMANATGGTPSYSYLWNDPSSQTVQTATGLSPGDYTVTVTDANGCTITASATISQPNALSATVSSTNVTCYQAHDGTITISNPLGGWGTFQYSIDGGTTWQNKGSYTGLVISKYDVQIRDKANPGCVTNLNPALKITRPPILNATVSSTNVSCKGGNDGTITITSPSGGPSSLTGPGSYNFSIDGGITYPYGTGTISSLAPGSYDVLIQDATDINCTIDLGTQTLTAPTNALSATATWISDVTCNGNNNGSASSSASGGTGSYTYLWDDSETSQTATELSPGGHTVTVTDQNGCQATSNSVTISALNSPTAGITNNTATTVLNCSTTSISVTATGGGTYSWSDGANVVSSVADLSITAPGTYTVTVTSANRCTDTDAITVTQDISVPAAGITNNTGVTVLTCSTETISATATGGGSYSWSDGTNVVGSAADLSITGAGTYTVTVKSENGCSSTDDITITQDSSIPTAGITNNTGSTVLNSTTPSISLTATGGTTYSWSNGTSIVSSVAALTVTTAGTYSVTVSSSNGCYDTDEISITQGILAPSIQASGLTFSGVQTTQFTVSWTNGNGSSRVVFVRQANSGAATPVDLTTYAANTLLASGTQIGSTGWYCIYNGTGTTESVTGLTGGTNYIVQVFEYNGTSGSEKYDFSTATNNPLSVTTSTICTNPTSGGTIASSQTICSGTAPAAFTSTAAPSGNAGTLQYQWQSSTTSNSAGFTNIASATSATYKTGNLSATTWFIRLSRVSCESDWSSAASSNVLQITVNSLPSLVTVTGSTGVSIGLSGSQTGVSYQLVAGNTNTGSPVAGTGSALSFGIQSTAGTYTVVATNTTTLCLSTMTGSAVVSSGTSAYNVTGGGSYCTGGTGLPVGLSGSKRGALYQLKLNGRNIGNVTIGTGSAISFGLETVAGSYTVAAITVNPLTSTLMTGNAVITVIPLPTAPGPITGTKSICAGKTTTLLESATGGVWSSSNSSIAKISNTGVVTGLVSGSVTIKYTITNGSGCSNWAGTTVTVNSSPGEPGNFIVSLSTVNQGQRNVPYVVPAMSNVSYDWNYSGIGAAISGIANSVNINYSNSATSGILSVSAVNGCGISTPRSMMITVRKNNFKSDSIPSISSQGISDIPVLKNGLKVYPNPTLGPANFEFQIGETSRVTLDILSISGQHITRIFDADLAAGIPQTVYLGQVLPAGIYIGVMRWKSQILTVKLVVTQ